MSSVMMIVSHFAGKCQGVGADLEMFGGKYVEGADPYRFTPTAHPHGGEFAYYN